MGGTALSWGTFPPHPRPPCWAALKLVSLQINQTAQAGADPEADAEPMFGTLDYILLAAIGAAAIWWLFIRDTEADKIPEVCINNKARVLGAVNIHLLFSV